MVAGLRFWNWVLWDLVIATVVGTIAVQYGANSIADLLIGLGMAAALIARRRRPVAVFAAICALGLVQLAIATTPAAYDLAVPIAMVTVVTHVRSIRYAYVAGAAVALGTVLLVVVKVVIRQTGSVPDYTHLGEYSTLLALCMACWLIAYVLRANRERAATAERERDQLARLAAADQRAFIARELHDVVAHSLAVMIAQADGAGYVVATDTDAAREALRTVAATGRDALEDMHRIVGVLRGTDQADPAVDRGRIGLDRLDELVDRARGAGMAVELRLTGDVGRLSPAEELTVFRIVQEALTNTLRHAGPGARTEITVHVGDDGAAVAIDDDGGGRTAGPAAGRTGGKGTGGNGLGGMRERIAAHGGEITAGPRAGHGWAIRATIPIREVP